MIKAINKETTDSLIVIHSPSKNTSMLPVKISKKCVIADKSYFPPLKMEVCATFCAHL